MSSVAENTNATFLEDDQHALISSRTVEGTPIYGTNGERLGSVHSVMIDKESGQVAYAVLSFGGIFGIGQRVHPVPWEKLSFDRERYGYRVDFSADQIRDAPSLVLDEADRPTSRPYEERMYEYYGAQQYWTF